MRRCHRNDRNRARINQSEPKDAPSMTAANPSQSAEQKEFVISRKLAAPRTLVFAAFTEPERMKHWWGPKGFKVIAATMDLRPGGIYHYGLQAPDGSTMWGKFVYREIVRPER